MVPRHRDATRPTPEESARAASWFETSFGPDPTVEWTVYLSNSGSRETPVVADLQGSVVKPSQHAGGVSFNYIGA